METSKLERFAKYARRYLLEQVANKLQQVIAVGSDARRYNPKQVQGLEDELKKIKDKNLLIDKVAYTWFNRFCALRFMDVNNYTRVNIISPLPGQFQPEILSEAKAGHIDKELVNSTNRQRVFDLLSGKETHPDPQTEAYRILIISTCNYYARIMPFLFEYIADWTELLMPDDLLSGNSILSFIREALTPGACKDVEVIGWLYQFFISEKKDEVNVGIRKGKKIQSSEIPAVTQLFTPHWIVQYMVQNSLGKLWLQNHPQSTLIDKMKFYIKNESNRIDTKSIPDVNFLKLKSPEDIKLCDPCSGSGHILTYAFDLLFDIYSEEGYDSLQIPILIISKNLYGIEIDERAAELAAFALTMKARERDKLWFTRGIKPNICRLENISFSNDEIEAYMNKCGHDLFTYHFENMLHQFEDAETLGSLILPEEQDIEEINKILETKDFSGDVFFAPTHRKVMKLIEQANFLSAKYQTVITNPPYMSASGLNESFQKHIRQYFPNSRSDFFAMFIERCLSLAMERGIISMITMQSWMFLSSYEKLRKILTENYDVISMAHLGPHAFDSIGGEVVSTTSFTICKVLPSTAKGTYFDLREGRSETEKMNLFLEALSNPDCDYLYRAACLEFKMIAGYPIAYWVSDRMRSVIGNCELLSSIIVLRKGLATSDNQRFLREWHEVSVGNIKFDAASREESIISKKRWFPINKGGSFRKWYGNNEQIINWENDGYEIRNFFDKNGKLRSRPQNIDYSFKEALTWSKITSGQLSARFCFGGFLFDDAGAIGYSENISILKEVLPILSSKIGNAFLKILNPTLNYQIGDVARVPIYRNRLIPYQFESSIDKCLSVTKEDWDSFETSWDIKHLPLLKFVNEDLLIREAYHKLRKIWIDMTLEIQLLEEENNRTFLEAYGLQDEPKLEPDVLLNEITLTCNPYYRYSKKPDQQSINEFPLDSKLEADLLADTIKEFISYAVGCMFGRYSIDKPGLILANQGETIEEYLKQIHEPRFVPDKDNVIPILDGEWFADDIVNSFYEFVKVTFGEANFSQNLSFIEEAIGKSVRAYFLKDFYTDHVKRYKKRPIYWLFSSPNGSFNTLIYMHRYTPDTVSIILNGYLREYVYKLKSKASDLEQTVNSSSTSQKDKIIAGKELDKIKAMIIELDYWERDVLFNLAAKKLEIDLDDGVKTNYLKFGSALKKIPGLDKGEF